MDKGLCRCGFDKNSSRHALRSSHARCNFYISANCLQTIDEEETAGYNAVTGRTLVGF